MRIVFLITLLFVSKLILGQVNNQTEQQKETVKQPKNYCHKSRGQFVATGVFSGMSIGFAFAGRNKSTFDFQRAKFFYVTSGVSGVAAIIFLIRASMNKADCNKSKKITAQIGTNGIYLSYRF